MDNQWRIQIDRGVYTRGEWCEMHHGENWGKCCDDKLIMMLLLMSIIIYYYMNTFITLHQCTFNFAVCPFFYTVSQKNIPDVFSYNSRKHCRIFIIFGRNITEKVCNQKMLYFPTSPN